MSLKTLGFGLVPGLLLAGCGSAPPPELRDARSEYTRASHGVAAELAPADLQIAREQLIVANEAFRRDGPKPSTRDLAYTEFRKVQAAEVRAQTIAAQQQRDEAEAQLARLKDDQVKLTSAKLVATEQALALSEQQRVDAERRAQDAALTLIHIAAVKQEPRGLVITMPSAVLFTFGKYDLLPQAQTKLKEVADVLKKQDGDSKIVVQGYADSVGTDASNLELSRQRAESVRAFLVEHGLDPDRIKAGGYGTANPMGDNTSPEGRAENRRVEIIVQPARH
jgi:outer membrane protein OmpA-like peptidoglycan-associated protein